MESKNKRIKKLEDDNGQLWGAIQRLREQVMELSDRTYICLDKEGRTYRVNELVQQLIVYFGLTKKTPQPESTFAFEKKRKHGRYK